jgi:hypothetical protein
VIFSLSLDGVLDQEPALRRAARGARSRFS